MIACTRFMEGEVMTALHTPYDKLDIIPNGVDATKFMFDFPVEEAAAFRAQFAAPEEKIIMFVGRGVREKGAQVLIAALPKVRRYYHDAKLVIAGGGYRQHLVDQAYAMGVGLHVYFTGFIPDDDLLRPVQSGRHRLLPSLYEPFGIVALEAMAARTPSWSRTRAACPKWGKRRHRYYHVCRQRGKPGGRLLFDLHDPDRAQIMAAEAYHRIQSVFHLEAHRRADAYRLCSLLEGVSGVDW